MKGKQKISSLLLSIGAVFVAGAILLAGYNLYQEYRAGKTAQRALEGLLQQMQTLSTEDAGQTGTSSQSLLEQGELPDYLVNPNMEMPARQVEGNDYIGVLEIPSLELSLPVMSSWSYSNLKIAPCRYQGSAYTGSLTIVAHNYRTHFGPVRSLPQGAQVKFTDVKGRQFYYQVAAVETIEATAVQDAVSDDWDLTLITCTSSGQARVAVRCLKVKTA